MTATIDGVSATSSFVAWPSFSEGNTTIEDATGALANGGALGAGFMDSEGTFTCNASSVADIGVLVYETSDMVQYDSGKPGMTALGSCTVTITTLGGPGAEVVGTFSGTLLDAITHTKDVAVADGKFTVVHCP